MMPTQAERLFWALHASHAVKMLCINGTDTLLPTGEYMLLNNLYDQGNGSCGEVNLSDVKGKRHISLAAVSQLLGSLERKGLLQRSVSKLDRRKIVVNLTGAGIDMVHQVRSAVDATVCEIIARFGSEPTEQLIRLMGELNELAEQMLRENQNKKDQKKG